MSFHVAATGTAPLSFQWFRNGVPVTNAVAAVYTFTTTAADHNSQVSVRVSNPEGSILSVPATLRIDLGSPGPPQTNRLIKVTDLWRYNTAKLDLGTSWRSRDFVDAGWPAGGGLLYVENSSLPAPKTTQLVLDPGSLPMTCYFRTTFTNTLTQAYSVALVANAVVDDGLVLHLNGAEACRTGMPSGTIDYSTAASRTVTDAVWEGPLEVAATNLVEGINVVAAEVHQTSTSSTDIVMGLTLDLVWTPRFRDSNAPVATVFPVPGSTLASLSQVQVQFNEPVDGVDASDLKMNGLPAISVSLTASNLYTFHVPMVAAGVVNFAWDQNHGIVDQSAGANAFVGLPFSFLIATIASAEPLPLVESRQSTDAGPGNVASQAIDGLPGTFSLTRDEPGSWWQASFARAYPIERIELVAPPEPNTASLEGVLLRLFNLDDQVVFQTNLYNPGPGGIISVSLPAGTVARSTWIGLPEGITNGAGNYKIAIAEARAFGDTRIPFGPNPILPPTDSFRVWQSSEYGGFPAEYAVDGDSGNFTHTADLIDSHWMCDFGRAVAVDKVEVVNRSSCCDSRLAGLVLRLYDASSNSIGSTVLTNPGLGGTWSYTRGAGPPVRWIRIGLEDGAKNADGNFYVSLAEVRAYSGSTNLLNSTTSSPIPITPNLASFKPACMLRLDDSVPPASQANDGKYSTETKTTVRTVDGYWEVDLGDTFAIYGVRAIAASGIGWRLTNATIRLYDAAHDSVFATRVTGAPDAFDTDLNGPVFARHVRVGLEDKQRTDPAGGIEFYIGFREVEVFGRRTNEVGVLSFGASTNRVSAGQPVTLSWAVEDVNRVELHPAYGSVGGYTGTNGVGALTLAVTRTTEFTLIATNPAGIFSRSVTVEVDDKPAGVFISEIVADNKYSLEDGSGAAPDWIELRNSGNSPANLTGCGLSDDPLRPMRWVFPAAIIPPHGTLIVFASGNDSPVEPGGNLHASFRLAKEGGGVYLTGTDGVTLLDSLPAYPELDTDLAYGRNLEGMLAFLEPTPGKINATKSYLGWLKQVDWSHKRGFYDAPFLLNLTNNSPGSSLLYSMDGSPPGTSYASEISVAGTRAIRVQAVRPGYKPSRIQTRTFIFTSDVITSGVMNRAITQDPAYAPRMKPGLLALPSISLCVPGQPEYEEKEGSFEVLWPKGGLDVQVNCGIARFGNAWTKFAKRSFRVKCRARYGDAKVSVPLFAGFDRGVMAKTSFDELDLRSGSQDMVERGFYMAGRFVEDSMLDMGSLNPHGRFVHVYVNGVYWGQYDCREMLVTEFLSDYLGGEDEDYVNVRGNDNVVDDFVLGAPDPPQLAPWETSLAMKNSYASVKTLMDVPHLIDFMLLWNYGNSESEFRACGPVLPGTGFKFWIADADGFLRTSAMNLNRVNRTGPGGLFGGLVSEGAPDFKALLADRIYKHFFNGGALTPAANDARLAGRMAEIRDSLLAECARWNYRTPANWESSAATIRSSLFPARTSQLLGYLRAAGLYPAFDPPAFNQYGGLVTNGFQPVLTAPSGVIYYTTDGTDPRLAGGLVSPSARVWSPGAVTITGDATIRARVRTSTGLWSALAEPSYYVAPRRPPAPGDLLVTEIHYNPPGSDEYEFLELFNASTNLLDMAGVSLTNAVRYVFPSGRTLAPGACLVVVESIAAFAERYQTTNSLAFYPGIAVDGPWIGQLDNAGELISVLASNGVELASIAYAPGGEWSPAADGAGSSLELRILPSRDLNGQLAMAHMAAPTNWFASYLLNGSPGRLHVPDILPFGLEAVLEGNSVQIGFAAIPGVTYMVETCDNVAIADWQPLREVTATSAGYVLISDPVSTGGASRFYRVRSVP